MPTSSSPRTLLLASSTRISKIQYSFPPPPVPPTPPTREKRCPHMRCACRTSHASSVDPSNILPRCMPPAVDDYFLCNHTVLCSGASHGPRVGPHHHSSAGKVCVSCLAWRLWPDRRSLAGTEWLTVRPRSMRSRPTRLFSSSESPRLVRSPTP